MANETQRLSKNICEDVTMSCANDPNDESIPKDQQLNVHQQLKLKKMCEIHDDL